MAESHSTHSSRKPDLNDDDLWAEVVNEWVNSSLRNTAVSQSTQAWNHLTGPAMDDLRNILKRKL